MPSGVDSPRLLPTHMGPPCWVLALGAGAAAAAVMCGSNAAADATSGRNSVASRAPHAARHSSMRSRSCSSAGPPSAGGRCRPSSTLAVSRRCAFLVWGGRGGGGGSGRGWWVGAGSSGACHAARWRGAATLRPAACAASPPACARRRTHAARPPTPRPAPRPRRTLRSSTGKPPRTTACTLAGGSVARMSPRCRARLSTARFVAPTAGGGRSDGWSARSAQIYWFKSSMPRAGGRAGRACVGLQCVCRNARVGGVVAQLVGLPQEVGPLRPPLLVFCKVGRWLRAAAAAAGRLRLWCCHY